LTFYEYDPWFDASDNFIKEKEILEGMNSKEIREFWYNKGIENN
jgi:hypothetical protein